MTKSALDSRQRMVVAAADMLARHGLNATSIRELAKRADAPLGSTYHHFPRGKDQVIVEAITLAGARVDAGLELYLQAGNPAGLGQFIASWRDVLVRSKFRIGCPVMAAAIDEPLDAEGDATREAAAKVFAGWRRRLEKAFVSEGVGKDEAADLATLVIASLEGAVVLCRAEQSIEPFDRIARQIESLVGSQLRK